MIKTGKSRNSAAPLPFAGTNPIRFKELNVLVLSVRLPLTPLVTPRLDHIIKLNARNNRQNFRSPCRHFADENVMNLIFS